ncbi:MAG: hypothetical protein Q9201_005823 [Fulgogasparrea decipioides]
MEEDQVVSASAEAQAPLHVEDGWRFTSRLFIVSVGPDEIEYTIHEDCLKKSPVFARMCEGDFKEAHQQRINLPEDDPIQVGSIIEYLYTNAIWPGWECDHNTDMNETGTRLAHLYVAADKYDLDGLKDLVVEKFSALGDDDGIFGDWDWLAQADIIYSSIPEEDDLFPTLLRQWVFEYYKEYNEDVEKLKWLDERVHAGGRLAVDISSGCNDYLWTTIQRQRAAYRKLRKHVTRERDEHATKHHGCRFRFRPVPDDI